MSIAVRLNELIKSLGYSVNSFEKELGLSPTRISKIITRNSNVSSDILSKIGDRFPEVDRNWLLTGEGKMSSTTDTKTDSAFDEYPNMEIQNRFLLIVDGLGKSDVEMASDLHLDEKDFKLAIERYLIKWSFILKFCSHYEINANWLMSKEAPMVNGVIDIIKRFTNDGKQIEDLSLSEQQELNKRLAIRQEVENNVKHWNNITEQEFSLKQYHLKIDRELRTEDPQLFELLFNSRQLMALSKDLDKLVTAYIAPITSIAGNYTDYNDFRKDYVKNLKSKYIYADAISSVVKKLQNFVEKDFSKFDSQQIANEFSKLMKIEQRKFGKTIENTDDNN